MYACVCACVSLYRSRVAKLSGRAALYITGSSRQTPSLLPLDSSIPSLLTPLLFSLSRVTYRRTSQPFIHTLRSWWIVNTGSKLKNSQDYVSHAWNKLLPFACKMIWTFLLVSYFWMLYGSDFGSCTVLTLCIMWWVVLAVRCTFTTRQLWCCHRP